MSLILPKGIVVNTAGISGDIERIDREPLAIEEIAKFWKVYTTTKRRLLDPTAERLENYWWRIWGSRKRNLNGATVARLFADISDGRSFVPLRGPPNRYESGGRPTTSLPQSSGSAKTTTIHPRPESSSCSSPQSSNISKNSAPMPPPILKKNRGPSSTGPRPTARFISPHGSADEDPDGILSTNNGPDAHVVVRSPTPESQPSRLDRKSDVSGVGPRGKMQTTGSADSEYTGRPDVLRRPISDSAAQAPRTKTDVGFSVDSCILEAVKGSKTGKPQLTEATTRIGQLEMQRSKHSPSLQDSSATSNVLASKSIDDAKMVRNTRHVRKAEDVSAGNSIFLLPSNTGTVENIHFQGRLFSAGREDNDPAGFVGSRGGNPMTLEQGSLFAKRPVQPTKSASALFAISSPETTYPLSRSKSQLTLLLEKDRARMNEPKTTTEPSTSNVKEAEQIN